MAVNTERDQPDKNNKRQDAGDRYLSIRTRNPLDPYISSIGRSPNENIYTFTGYCQDIERFMEVGTTLSNGLRTIQPASSTNHGQEQVRGLFEKKPQEWENGTSTTFNTLNLPGSYFFFRLDDGMDNSRKVEREFRFDPKYKILKNITHSYNTYFLSSEKRMDVITTEFASKKRPHMAFRNVTFTPHFSGDMTVAIGINDEIADGDRVFYDDVRTDESEDKGILYEFGTKYKGEKICIGQQAEITSSDEVITHKPVIEKEDGAIYQKFDIKAVEGKTYTLSIASSIHTTADKEILDGADYSLRGAVLEDLDKRPTFADALQEHKEAWDKLYHDIHVSITGDDEIQQALTFNHATVLASLDEGNQHAGMGAKEGADKFAHVYGGRQFWDAPIYCKDSLTPALLKTMLLYIHNQLPAARKKAKKFVPDTDYRYSYNHPWSMMKKLNKYKDDPPLGAFFPWQASRPEYGEGCPADVHVYGKISPLPIVELYEEIHISADVAYFAMQNYLITGDKEILKNQGAEIIIEAARFYLNRANYNQEKDRYELKKVTGPDEYHHHVDNNAFTNGMAKWTTLQALELLEAGMVSEKTRKAVGLSDKEITRFKDFAEKLYIPFNPATFIFTQFDGWENLRHVDLTQFPGVKFMDVALRPERDSNSPPITEDDIFAAQKTDVIKQHDGALLPNLLGRDILKILPRQALIALRAQNLTDEEIISKIYEANYRKHCPQTCDGSSLSPITGVIIALDAGVNPDDVYAKYREAVLMDLEESQTHHTPYHTENGLHTGAAGGSMQATIRGFGGIKPENDVLSINPRLPTKWKELKYRSYYKGVHFEVKIDKANNEITVELLEPRSGDSIPLNINGNAILLGSEKITVPYKKKLSKNIRIYNLINPKKYFCGAKWT